MSESGDWCLIGIDGGGTSCRIAVVRGGVRSEVTGGSTNVTTDVKAAVQAIVAALHEVAGIAGLSMDVIRNSYAYVGLAGVTGPEMARTVAGELPLDRCVVEEDRRAAVVGALGSDDGAVAGIGTGSFVARQTAGGFRSVGGWGIVLGDEASGAWLGRGILSRVLSVVDGMADATELTGAVFSEFDNDPAALVAFSATASPGDIASFARPVIDAAASGDPAARDLMETGAGYIERALSVLGWSPDEKLCLVGGVAGHYAPFLSPAAANAVVPAKARALDGALALAERMRRSEMKALA